MSYDCQRCGACCFSDSARYVPVTGRDYDRLGEDMADALVWWDENRAYLRMHDGRCAALVREGHRFSCSIYERRPDICRELARGSPACAAERSLKLARSLRVLRG